MENKHLVNGYCMKSGNNHGIDKVNLRLAPGAWRIVLMFRNLQKSIRKQAINHKNVCKNNDTNMTTMQNCQCRLMR